MHLIRDDMTRICPAAAALFCNVYKIDPGKLLDHDYVRRHIPESEMGHYADAVDFYVTGYLARTGKTFIFDAEQIMAFLAAIDRHLPPGDYPPPFNELVIQFSEGIPEDLFLSGGHSTGRGSDQGDKVVGLVLGFPGDRGHVVNVIAWYASTSINRVALDIKSDGAVAYNPIGGGGNEANAKDKQRIVNLGLLCLAYIHSPGIEVEHVAPDPAVNRKRKAKGKAELPDYYVCRVSKRRYGAGEAGEATGRQVSFRFDVRGHFRRLPDGRTVWIRAHQRGIEHELYKPKSYRVE